MTSLVGIVYPGGMVVASDRLRVSDIGVPFKNLEKIRQNNPLFWGYQGTYGEIATEMVQRKIKELLQTQSPEAVIKDKLSDLFDRIDYSTARQRSFPIWDMMGRPSDFEPALTRCN